VLLIVTAGIEAGAGLGLLLAPALVAWLLLGGKLDTAATVMLARVCGVALLSLGVACWMARNGGASSAARGLVAAMGLYNVAVAALLVYAGTVAGLSAIGLWPAVVLHIGMAAWCLAILRARPTSP
jgi:hypothetical protein